MRGAKTHVPHAFMEGTGSKSPYVLCSLYSSKILVLVNTPVPAHGTRDLCTLLCLRVPFVTTDSECFL
jgi:hypothetical protein